MKFKNSSLFTSRLSKLDHRINKACLQNKRERSSIKILAVTKKKSVDDIRLAISHGLKNFGENYLNEAIEKKSMLEEESNKNFIEWHYIGSIQKNKTKKIAENFNWIHSVDRFEVAQRLSDQRPLNMEPLKIFLQINIDEETTKSGVMPQKAKELAILIAKLPNLNLHGLMAIPTASGLLEDQKRSFLKLRELKNKINKLNEIKTKLKSLSMGMSSDLEAAIDACDSNTETWLRIGTALFGKRN